VMTMWWWWWWWWYKRSEHETTTTTVRACVRAHVNDAAARLGGSERESARDRHSHAHAPALRLRRYCLLACSL